MFRKMFEVFDRLAGRELIIGDSRRLVRLGRDE